jgi:nicotinate-nucleotide adenylyltransferase
MTVGLFGGAFDPFHKEHEKVAEAAIKELSLEKLVLVPSFNPPHKDNTVADFEHRVRMLELFAEEKKYVIVDRIESQTGFDKNYAYEVIPLLKEKYGTCIYIIGGDSMANFHRWAKPDVIAKEIPVAVAMREGFPGAEEAIKHAEEAYNAQIIRLSVVGEEISSGEIRARLELEMDVCGMLDSRIAEYIRKQGLYKEYADIVAKLKNAIGAKLYIHSANTAIFAARHAALAGVSFYKAFCAGLLHDCAKERVVSCEGYPTDSLAVVHQYMGAETIEKEYGITDPEIMSAVACHTTGKPAMSPLDKLIYIADKLEDGREYEGVEALRAALLRGLDEGFFAVLRSSAAHLKSKSTKADGLTKACMDYYNIV